MGRDEIAARIRDLKIRRGALILAHNYQLGEVQDVADIVGDSLELSRAAASSEADAIVFCGVRFMAETAKLLSPGKTVLLPDARAGCWMADMVDVPGLERLKSEHPGTPVVCYVNSSVEVKAHSDVCCTSANAAAVVNAVARDRAIFVPDMNLGAWVARQTGKDLVLWPGWCLSHVRILPEDIERRRREFPDAVVMAHPECHPAVSAMADRVLSTGGMIEFARKCGAGRIIVATEIGILHRLQKENPGKSFIPASEAAVCPNMKLTSLESLLECLENMETRIEIDGPVARKASAAVGKMLAIR